MKRRVQAGFTMVEVMIAVMLTAIAVIGIVGLYRVQTRSSGYARLATEASVLAADKLETLRTVITPVSGTEAGVDARGKVGVGGPYTRTWTVTQPVTSQWNLEVEVAWDDDGTPRTVKLHAIRGL
jgi:Tfp pilus assembly protein PilV